MPVCTRCSNSRAVRPSAVKIAEPLPYWFELTSASASSNVSARSSTSTGPKISSR